MSDKSLLEFVEFCQVGIVAHTPDDDEHDLLNLEDAGQAMMQRHRWQSAIQCVEEYRAYLCRVSEVQA